LRSYSSLSQEIPHLLWNPKIHNRVHKRRPLVPILSQMHPIHASPPYFPKTHSNIIFISTPITFRNKLLPYGEELLAPRQTLKLEGQPLSAIRDRLFNIFASTVHIWTHRSVICNRASTDVSYFHIRLFWDYDRYNSWQQENIVQ
jgi:hypothetical protein